jgi:hypothetical protein
LAEEKIMQKNTYKFVRFLALTILIVSATFQWAFPIDITDKSDMSGRSFKATVKGQFTTEEAFGTAHKYFDKNGKWAIFTKENNREDVDIFTILYYDNKKFISADMIGNFFIPFELSRDGRLIIEARYLPNEESGKFYLYKFTRKTQSIDRAKTIKISRLLNPVLTLDGRYCLYLKKINKSLALYCIDLDREITKDDISDWSKFLSKLKYCKLTVHKFVLSQLDNHSRQIVLSTSANRRISEEAKSIIVHSLNRFMNKCRGTSGLVSDDRIENLMPITGFDISSYPAPSVSVSTENRLFLENIFPDCIKKSSLPVRLFECTSYSIW